MDVATLVARLSPLLDDPIAKSEAILELLGRGRGLAEYEVARFLVTKRTEPIVRELLASPDPRERRKAVRWVELTFARAPAALVLRDATKDRSTMVRRAAMAATRALRLKDVALPDTRGLSKVKAIPAGMRRNPFTGVMQHFPARPAAKKHRGWNPTGWRFGLYRSPWGARGRRPWPEISQLQTRADVEKLLGVDRATLTKLLRPGAGPGKPYVAFEIPKATGGTRTLHAPRPALKRLQRIVLRKLLAGLEAHPSAHGFVDERSVVSNAKPHVGARIVVKMDLVDFFPTIHFGRLTGLFQHYGAGKEAAETLAAIVTWREELPDGHVAWPSVLPQGAPTSPALSNLVCRRLDARLAALATKVDAQYTRYADDLTFSFAMEPEKGLGHFLWWTNQIIGQEGFRENLKKRRVLKPGGQQRVTGVVTNTRLAIPREARRRFRAVLHHCKRFGVTKEATRHEQPRAYLLGFASWVAMVQPELGAKLLAEVRALLSEETKP
jgi:RNA-directed DNA polymerase